MGCSRSNFYWFFKDREVLLAELLAHWQAKNTAAIVDRAARPATRISLGVLNFFDCGADPDVFDARLDFAVREWARRSDAVATEVTRADTLRLDAITDLFARFDASPTQAIAGPEHCISCKLATTPSGYERHQHSAGVAFGLCLCILWRSA